MHVCGGADPIFLVPPSWERTCNQPQGPTAPPLIGGLVKRRVARSSSREDVSSVWPYSGYLIYCSGIAVNASSRICAAICIGLTLRPPVLACSARRESRRLVASLIGTLG